jgi:branched-chain amino acid transport system substrate-binding protein
MPLVSCAASAKIIEPVTDRKYVFKTAQTDTLAIQKILGYLGKQGVKKVAFINDGNAFGQSGRGQWEVLSKGAGITTVALESFATDDTDMTSQLTSIRAKNPDAVVCWGTDQGSHQVARDMRKLGMKQPLIMSHGIANRAFIDSAGPAAEGVIFPSGKLIIADHIPDDDPQKETLLKYRGDYVAAYSEDKLSTFGGHAWDALKLVVKALEEAGADREKIRDALENTTGFVGITGVFDFSADDHGGLTEDAFEMVTIKNGEWVIVQ